MIIIARRNFLFLVIGLVCITMFLSGCSNRSADRKMETKQPTRVNAPQKPALQDRKQPVSGPVRTVPWEKDRKFKNKQQETGTPVQMAAFRTVLRDPLPGEEQNVHLAARLLTGTVLQPGQVFSQNLTIGPYNRDRGFQIGPVYSGSQVKTTIGGGVCKIASTLYNVAVLCNLPVTERTPHAMPVPYVPYGQDATVSYGVNDFKFKNNLPYPILIWAQGVDNILYIAFYGQSQPPKVEWHHQFLERQKASKIYRQNSALSKGEEKIAVKGMDGAVVKSWVTIANKNGSTTTKQLGISSYKPMPYIIEQNSPANNSSK
ncbi:MAG: VanW family protein [Syntrophomonas sp.]